MATGPFGSGFATADYTQEINKIPNTFGRIQAMGLFTPESVDTDTVIIDQVDETLSVLSSKERGSPAPRQNPETRKTMALTIPHFPLDDYITPRDVRAQRAPGSQQLDSTTRVRLKKANSLARSHRQTLEFLRMGALKGVVVDGGGNTLVNLFTEFGITEESVDLLLGTATTDVAGLVLGAKRHIEQNVASGELINGYHCFCSPLFYDKLVAHTKVREAYSQYTSIAEPLREDRRSGFVWQGIMFEEYNAQVKDAAGAIQKFVPDNDARLFPTGVSDMFVNYFAPADHMDHVNTLGQEMYLFEYEDPRGRYIELHSESNPLTICRRPQALVKLTTSN